MSVLDIIKYPDRLLRRESQALEDVSDEIRRLFDHMAETMYEANGIGLAAVQVGVPKRIITIDVSRDEDSEERNPIFVANPEILSRSDEMSVYEEGCLSIPGQFAEIERPARVRVRFVDYHGMSQELEAEGLLATVLQHEIDHLDGRLFIDHLSRLKRDVIVKKIAKAGRNADPAKEKV